VGIFAIAYLGTILFGSFSRIWGVDRTLTLEHFRIALSYARELKNTVWYASLAGALCVALSATAAYLSGRVHAPFARVVELTTILPAAIPHILIGLAFALSFNGAPLPLTGTGAILVFAMAVSYLPFGYRVISAALAQLRESLDDAAQSLGASRARVFFDILAPLVGGAFAATFAFAFVLSTGTMSAVIFLVSFGTPLTSITILNLAEMGSWGDAAALASILTAFAFAGVGIARVLAGKRFFGMVFQS